MKPQVPPTQTLSPNKIESSRSRPVVIIGAGLSGLACAIELEKLGHCCLVLEASDDVGGRVRTDVTPDGFRLDRGFQVLLPSYSECERLLDYDKLELCKFHSGAWIDTDKGRIRLGDPLQEPSQLLPTLFSALGTFQDKLLVMKMRMETIGKSDEDLLNSGGASTRAYLIKYGFSESFIRGFWEPFFAGVFLETKLETDSGFFQFLCRQFAKAAVAVPRLGMGEIAKQLAAKLTASEIRFQSRVQKIDAGRGVELESGEFIEAAAIVCATEARAAHKLLGARVSLSESRTARTYYFAAPASPIDGPWLWLRSHEHKGLLNHVAVLSEVSPSYAPAGQALISVSVVSDALASSAHAVPIELTEELAKHFGEASGLWRHLATYVVPDALPAFLQRHAPQTQLEPKLFICGDHVETPSLQGALLSGTRAARALAEAHPRNDDGEAATV